MLKILSTGLIAILLLACYTTQQPMVREPQEVILKIESTQPVSVNGTDTITKTMSLPYEQGQLSGITFVCDKIGHTKIFSGLSISDVTKFWSDLCILRSRGINHVKMFINSQGGDAFTGLAMADEIERGIRLGMIIEAHASGIIASAAVPVFASCSKRYAAPGTIFMVHEATLWKWPGRETASDIRSQNELMSLLRDRYMNKMVNHSKIGRDQWEHMEGKTTWFSVEQAKEYGIVDEVQ